MSVTLPSIYIFSMDDCPCCCVFPCRCVGGRAGYQDISDSTSGMRPFNVEIIFQELIGHDGGKRICRPPYEQIERYFKRSYPALCSFRDTDVTYVKCVGFPITKIENRSLFKVKLYKGYPADCSILLINEGDISSISVNRLLGWLWRKLFWRKKAVLVIISGGLSTEQSFQRLEFQVGEKWKGVVISNPSSLDVLEGVRLALGNRVGTSNRVNHVAQWLDDPERLRQKLCIAGRGTKTVEKVQKLVDDSFDHTDIETQRLHITSSVIQTNLQSVTHAICCADRSERNILFSALGEPDELTHTVNYFEEARKRTLIIEYGGKDPAEDQLYDTEVFNDSMKRGQPRLKAFIDKNRFISLSEKLNEKQKQAILCWLGRDEDETVVFDRK